MANLKVLLADDEPDVLKVMAKRIVSDGFSVVTAHNGEDAWEKIRQENPDVIVLDLNMPGLDGFAVLKNLRERPPSGKWQPVIIVSARAELNDMQRGFSLEADHYITKPCNIEDILKGIRMMVALIPQRKSKVELDNEAR